MKQARRRREPEVDDAVHLAETRDQHGSASQAIGRWPVSGQPLGEADP
jgi:hypothetical protein